MRPNEFQPAAEVREHEEAFGAIMRKAGVLNGEISRYERMNIQKALELGRLLLRARPMAAGEWEKTLEEQGISSQRASEFAWGASQPIEQQQKWESIGDLRRARADKSGPSGVRTPTGGGTPPSVSTNPAAGAMSPPQKPEKLCGSCQRKGWQADCEDCAKLNKTLGGKKGTATSTKGNKPLAGKGGGSKPPKNGAIRWEWKTFDASFGVVVREVDRLGNAYQAKESAEAERVRKLLSEAREALLAWHKSLTGKK